MSWSILAMFAVWLGYGLLQWRRSARLFARLSRVDRAKRPLIALLLLLGGAVLLLGGLYGVFRAGGFNGSDVTPLAWPVCVIMGLVFVHSQVLAGVLLVSQSVTPNVPEPSQPKESQS